MIFNYLFKISLVVVLLLLLFSVWSGLVLL